MTSVRAVLLDVGGVFHLPDHERVAAALGHLDLGQDAQRCDRAHYAGLAALSCFEEADREVWTAYHRRYAESLGAVGAQVDEAAEVLLDTFLGDEMWTRVIPGSRAALAELAAAGFILAIVSNATGTVEGQLRANAICQVGPGPGIPVEAVIDSSVVGYAKPDPRIFALTLERLGVRPDEAVHVGDTPGADVVGARAAGVRAILVDPYDDHSDLDVERVHSLAEVPELLRR